MTDKTLSNDELLTVLITALNSLREVEGDMMLTKALSLLHVYRTPGIAQMDLPALVGASNPAVTRNVQDWAALDRNSKPGRGFISQTPDPSFRKRNILEPTSKGQAFLAKTLDRVNRTLAGTRP